MNSRVHGSEKALAELAFGKCGTSKPRLLVGGLGMGFTLAAALKAVGPDAVVPSRSWCRRSSTWNRTLIGAPAGHPLDGPADRVYVGDVADAIRRDGGRIRRHSHGCRQRARSARPPRERLAVRRRGLRATRPRCVRAACWRSGRPARTARFRKRLRHAGFDVREHVVRPHRAGKGPRHQIWIAIG